jgi:predicted ATPase
MGGPSERDRGQRLARLVRVVPPFVGRTQELAWLTHLLQEAVAGHPRVILITGEAGIGKTRLLEEMRSGALRHGIQVCYGRCHEDLILPYLPFVEVSRPLEPIGHKYWAILRRWAFRSTESTPSRHTAPFLLAWAFWLRVPSTWSYLYARAMPVQTVEAKILQSLRTLEQGSP